MNGYDWVLKLLSGGGLLALLGQLIKYIYEYWQNRNKTDATVQVATIESKDKDRSLAVEVMRERLESMKERMDDLKTQLNEMNDEFQAMEKQLREKDEEIEMWRRRALDLGWVESEAN